MDRRRARELLSPHTPHYRQQNPFPESGLVDRISSNPAEKTAGRPILTKEERNHQIRERYANGETLQSIAKDIGLSLWSVYAQCKGVERKTGRVRTPKARIQELIPEIRERYINGETQQSIAKSLGISYGAVRRHCKGVERKITPKRDPKKSSRKPDPEKEKRNQQMRERYSNGEALSSIAKDFNVSRQAVHSLCKGVERNAGRLTKGRIKELVSEIRERYANGETQQSIAKDLGISQHTVYRHCKRVERKTTSRAGRKPDPEKERRNQEIRERYANGETQQSIAKDMGISQQTVSKHCKRLKHNQ